MKNISFGNILLVGLVALFSLNSCVSRKNMVYFQNIEEIKKTINPNRNNNLRIKPDDILTIRVTTPEQEAALPFNLTKSIASKNSIQGSVELETYLVSDEGTIEFPVIGTMEVEGYTNIELASIIKEKINEYVIDAIVNVRIMNFQVSILGEVRDPGTFSIEDDHISLPKALGLAGDLTIFGKRENILIVREDNQSTQYAYLDLTDADVMQSPYYNLKQNDIVYVEPKGPRRQSASSLNTASSYLSLVSVLISIGLVIINL